MEYKICDQCKGVNVASLQKKILKIDNAATFDVRCHNLCGIGRTKPFVIVGHIPVIADTEEELIQKLKEIRK